MLNENDLNKLFNKEIEYILLPFGYRITCNQYKQCFISRGGKKKYFLNRYFIKYLCTLKLNYKEDSVIDAIDEIDTILKDKKISEKIRTKLEQIKYILENSLE